MDAGTILQILVSPLLGTVFDNLSSLIGSEFALVWGVNRELEKLSNTLSTIRDVIQDAEVKQIRDKPIRNWLRKLKDISYFAEDVLDEFATETALRPDHQSEIIETNKSCSNNAHQVFTSSVSSCFDFKRILFRRTIGKRIKKLRERFDEIAEERSKFHLNLNLNNGEVESRVKQRRQTSSFPAAPQVYGRGKDKECIVNLLLSNIGVANGNDDDDLQGRYVSVCAILGMGGLGKTTLAQMGHNDERIGNHFEVKCWVCVSENFELKTLFKAILESLGANAHDLENLDPLQRHLQERLGGKRFLLVLDDVWNEDRAKWDRFASSLRCGAKGSSIIITTRLQTVAWITATIPIWYLGSLSEEECWSLFNHNAFVGNENVHPNLEAIGKQIVKKCVGVPLAAKFLGGLLCFKREEHEWLFVRNSEIWDLPQDIEDAILPALRLSYNHLPQHLRQCFAYCSIFPKGYIMGKDELIHLWVANDFVQSKGGIMELEDVGNEIFNDLSWRSFFQDFKTDERGNIIGCKLHDLVHDLARSIMGDECSIVDVGKTDGTVGKGITSTRHLSLLFGYSTSSYSTILDSILPKTPQHVHTLLQLHCWSIDKSFPLQLIFSNLKWLRVLDLSQTDIRTMPYSIGNLIHLRYLNLSYTSITSLPNGVFCSLRNLQTLRLNGCDKLQMLPEDMTKLRRLRHLYLRGCMELTRMPTGMRKLKCLQTLSFFIVGQETGCGIEELQGVDHLRGKLVIKAMENVRNSTDARNANLMRKQNLHSLSLVWSGASQIQQNNSTSENQEEEVLVIIGEGLQCHPNIKRMRMDGYGGAKFPSWMGSFSCLPNLVKISLVDCRRCEHVPSLGQLPLLKVLKIRGMDSVKYINDEFYYVDHHHRQGSFFPSLDELEICLMRNLEEWSSPSPSSSFPCLTKLKVINCHKLRRCPPLPQSLQYLELWGCHDMTVIESLDRLPCLSSILVQ